MNDATPPSIPPHPGEGGRRGDGVPEDTTPGIVSVYAVFADEAEARRIARIAVEERLAACANVLGPCFSIYRWQSRIEEAGEVAAIFKTTAVAAPALIARIAALHSYDVPAAVAWPIADALASYAEWVAENVETSADGVEVT